MIEIEYIRLLEQFDDWYNEVGDKINDKLVYAPIAELAHFIREILPLYPGDIEYILNDDQTDIYDNAAKYWMYNEKYGFKN